MRSGCYRNVLSRFGGFYFRGPITKAVSRCIPRHQLSSGTARKYLGTGGALLSLSLFGKKKEETEEKKNGPNIDAMIGEADLLYSAYLIDNAYGLLRRHRSSENPEVLWRLARVICEQGKQSQNDEEKKRLFREALEFAEKALKFEPTRGSFGAHKWYAIMLNLVSEIDGDKAQLAKAMEVKSHFERALEIDSMDATTWHSLGVWHFSFADLSTRQRWLASILYSKPPESTFEEALRHFERAEMINPGFYSANNYYLGLTYERLGQREKALERLKAAFFAPVISMDDQKTHRKAYEHLKKKYRLKAEELSREPPTPPKRAK